MGDEQPMIEETNIVPLFKTYEELISDEKKILADCETESEAAFKAFEVARDAIISDDVALAKVVDTTVSPLAALKKFSRYAALAKLYPALFAQIETMSNQFAVVSAEHKALKKQISTKREVIQTLENARKAAIDKRDGRLFGLTALAKRSMRFASAHERRNYGPGATSLPPAS
jgi:hypothetical protein